MFISWLSQLVALLDKVESPAIHPILMRIANTYPQALSYPIKISSNDYSFDSTPQGQAKKEAVRE
jgi:DNA-dependent protein kinase catalytic subunit